MGIDTHTAKNCIIIYFFHLSTFYLNKKNLLSTIYVRMSIRITCSYIHARCIVIMSSCSQTIYGSYKIGKNSNSHCIASSQDTRLFPLHFRRISLHTLLRPPPASFISRPMRAPSRPTQHHVDDCCFLSLLEFCAHFLMFVLLLLSICTKSIIKLLPQLLAARCQFRNSNCVFLPACLHSLAGNQIAQTPSLLVCDHFPFQCVCACVYVCLLHACRPPAASQSLSVLISCNYVATYDIAPIAVKWLPLQLRAASNSSSSSSPSYLYVNVGERCQFERH